MSNIAAAQKSHFDMTPKSETGTPWSSREIKLTIATYFDMLQKERAGEPYVKLHNNEELQQQIGRTHKAIEFKHQNISAILHELALPWIQGYKPASNYQKALFDGIEHYLEANPDIFNPPHIPPDVLEETYLVPETAPTPTPREQETELLTQLVRKFDPAERDKRNRKLGKLGEERILISERVHLMEIGRKDLSKKVKWVSQEEGDGAGYDILSFSDSGDEKLLEVKTTTGSKYTPFYLTENERQLSVERPDQFQIIRVYNFLRAPKVFELTPPLEQAVTLRPTIYRASFN